MNFNFKIYNYDYKNIIKLQDISSTGLVKSKKNFPIFKENGKEFIFKPLSKTKPLLTPLFGCSEVFWSTIINQYFDSDTPIYRLAYCNNLDKKIEKKYSKGIIVESVIKKNEKLVNLLEYYNKHNDNLVNIKNYINYCGIYYDYTNILLSDLFIKNNTLGPELAKQILISILKNDINYHYENVSLKYNKENLISLAPPIDHEFSSFFIYPDNENMYSLYYNSYNMVLLFDTFNEYIKNENIIKNLNLISNLYPNDVKKFLFNLERFICDFKKFDFVLPKEYMEPLSSDMYKIYKQGKQKKEIKLTNLNINKYSKKIKEDILVCTHSLYTYLDNQISNKVLYKKKNI